MNEPEVKKLVEKYLAGKCTDDEKALLESWYLGHNESLPSKLSEQDIESATARIRERLDLRIQPKRNLPWRRYAAAAAITGVIIGAGLFIMRTSPAKLAANDGPHDLAPASNRAILKTAGGKSYTLADLPDGQLKNINQVIVNKPSGNELLYQSSAEDGGGYDQKFDTLIVPPGGKTYHLALSDGTNVWLNTGTRFRYPEKFAPGQRQVELISGEMYFKVSFDADRPFSISTHDQIIQDLGTEFDVNAYNDEPAVVTTLLEGSVKVSKGRDVVTLIPGQAVSAVNNSAGLSLEPHINTEMATAWKRGLFQFENTPLKEVMRQLARWYDVHIVYEGDVADRLFSGKLYRDINASQLLDVLTYNKIHYRINGKTLTIMP